MIEIISSQILLLMCHSIAIESSHKGRTLLANMTSCSGLGPTQIAIESPWAEQLVCERQTILIIKRNTFGPQNLQLTDHFPMAPIRFH